MALGRADLLRDGSDLAFARLTRVSQTEVAGDPTEQLSDTHRIRPSMKRLALALTLLTTAPLAQAQSPNATAAEALFSDAKRLIDSGDFAAACPKLAESQKLDPGTGTLLNLADCYEREGKLASAWTAWLEAAGSARAQGQTEREDLARRQAKTLEQRLGRVTIHVQTAAAERPAGLRVAMDGLDLASATWGTALPADKGAHEIFVTAPGCKTFRGEVMVADGQATDIHIPELPRQQSTAASPAPDERPAAEVQPGEVVPPPERPATGPPRGRAHRILGWSAAGLGAVGIGIGSAFGASAISKNQESMAQCDPVDTNRCNSLGVDMRNEALSAGNAATVGFIVGGALVATGLTLVILAPKGTTVGFSGGPGNASVSLGGRF